MENIRRHSITVPLVRVVLLVEVSAETGQVIVTSRSSASL